MTQHFIEDIKIENFKCFESLDIFGFKRVNVFGGKNNVGKTALLEAIELLVKSGEPAFLVVNLFALLKRRQQYIRGGADLDSFLGLFKESYRWFIVKSNYSEISINLDAVFQKDLNLEMDINEDVKSNGVKFRVNKSELIISADRILNRSLPLMLRDRSILNKVPSFYVKSSKLDDGEVATLYGGIVEADKEVFLNESLKLFDNSILSFKAIPTDREAKSKLKLIGREKLVSLSEMGDGISRYVTILCAIWASQNGFLFIDEIENGIHYSNYKKLWELIFMASEQANCQVFVTSHSKECITAFNDVQQERVDDAGRYFELYRSQKKQRIVAAVRDAEQLHYSLTHGATIRGE
ncbi:AAA family ATPase [Thiothrix sp.]|jgi:AAA15 family ATPase/GTPase|uniref:AAA family ATPase n=1 Tax=Thiothrix sp. TaxID=1032 RepID=UPI00257F2323|nr:AAA family ATPase [Thiothrix sp.]